VGSVLAHLVDRLRSCYAWIKSVRGVTYSPAPRTQGIVACAGRHLCWRRESGFRWPDRAATPSSPAGRSGRADCREERSTSLTPTGFSHGQAIRVALTSTRIRHASTSAFRNKCGPSRRLTRCGTVCPERTVGSVLANLVDQLRSCYAWIKSVRGVTYSPAPRTRYTANVT
jgi:hypothetical protein